MQILGRKRTLYHLKRKLKFLCLFFFLLNVHTLHPHQQLTPEVVEELLEHFMDPEHGSNSKGRKDHWYVLPAC